VGMAAALRSATAGWRAETERVGALRDRMADALRATVPGLHETAAPRRGDGTVDRSGKLANSCHVRVEGVEQEELVVLLDEAGVCASAGAACASGALEPSHVLRSMGVGADESRTALRLTLGHTTTAADVDHVVDVLPKVVEHLRS